MKFLLPSDADNCGVCMGIADDMVEQGEQFDVVCSLEVIEHVSDVPAFLHSLTPLVKVRVYNAGVMGLELK